MLLRSRITLPTFADGYWQRRNGRAPMSALFVADGRAARADRAQPADLHAASARPCRSSLPAPAGRWSMPRCSARVEARPGRAGPASSACAGWSAPTSSPARRPAALARESIRGRRRACSCIARCLAAAGLLAAHCAALGRPAAGAAGGRRAVRRASETAVRRAALPHRCRARPRRWLPTGHVHDLPSGRPAVRGRRAGLHASARKRGDAAALEALLAAAAASGRRLVSRARPTHWSPRSRTDEHARSECQSPGCAAARAACSSRPTGCASQSSATARRDAGRRRHRGRRAASRPAC